MLQEPHSMKGRGRPKWVPSADDINKAETYAKAGLTEEQISDALGISQDTIIRRKKEYSEFSDAIKRGKAQGIGIVASSLMNQCLKEGNVTAMIFYLKTRAGWKETAVNEHTGKDGQSIQHDVKVAIANENWNARVAEIMEKE